MVFPTGLDNLLLVPLLCLEEDMCNGRTAKSGLQSTGESENLWH